MCILGNRSPTVLDLLSTEVNQSSRNISTSHVSTSERGISAQYVLTALPRGSTCLPIDFALDTAISSDY